MRLAVMVVQEVVVVVEVQPLLAVQEQVYKEQLALLVATLHMVAVAVAVE
jgi:hypothetical protein